MSEPHDHHDHAARVSVPDSGVQDVGSRALAEALGSSFFFVKIVMVLLVIVFLASGVVTVGPQERAIILRFGKAQGQGQAQLLGPGLHFAFPPPIDEVVKIPIGEIQTAISTVGWYATPQQEATATVPLPRGSLNPATDGYILTGDGNIVHVRAVIGYRVTDALAYVFNFVGASNVVQTILDHSLVWATARMNVDDAIKSNDIIKEKIMAQFTRLADELNLGITLDTLTVTIVPPRYIKESFDAVTGAESDRSKTILAAQGEANILLASARAEANAVVNIGKAARTRYVEAIAAEARSFSEQLPEYKKNTELFRQRLLTETWQRVLANASDKILIPDRVDGKQRELRILLNREPERPRTNSPAGS
jgi:membrane protease subunit HflK